MIIFGGFLRALLSISLAVCEYLKLGEDSTLECKKYTKQVWLEYFQNMLIIKTF